MKIKTKILALILSAAFLLPILASPSALADTTCHNQDAQSLQNCLHQNPIVKDINVAVGVLGGIVGVVVIGSLIFAGIQYSFAGASAQAATNARNRIISSLLAFACFLLIFAFIEWLIPGGVFG